jgi:PKD repeat protein
VPAIVDFHNTSTNSNSFLWDFGDGTTSTSVNPSHTYTTLGLYNVKLIAYASGSCTGSDSITLYSLVNIDSALPCVILMPANGTNAIQTSCVGILYDNGGTGNYSDNTNSVTTIAPADSTGITITFSSFFFELNWDYLNIYDGPSILSPLIGSYTGDILPNGGVIVASGNSITIQQLSDVYVTESGFEILWECGSVGINNASQEEDQIQISPNPTNGNFNLSFNGNTNKISVVVIDLLGNDIYESNYNIPDGKLKESFDLSYLSRGVYILKIITSEKNSTRKLIFD